MTKFPFEAIINSDYVVTVISPYETRFARWLETEEQPVRLELDQLLDSREIEPVYQQLTFDDIEVTYSWSPEPRGTPEDCLVDVTLRALRTRSETARNGYLAAAQWFALAARERR